MKKIKKEYCEVCGAELIYVDHWEDDGDMGSHEPYFECPEGCEPLDTETEFGVIDGKEISSKKESEII